MFHLLEMIDTRLLSLENKLLETMVLREVAILR